MSKFIFRPNSNDPKEILQELLNVPKVEQRSEEWYQLRKQILTASSIASIIQAKNVAKYYNKITPKEKHIEETGYCNSYDTPYDFYAARLGYTTFTGNKATLFGQKYEYIAQKFYELKMNTKIHEFGTIISDKTPILGASPDGISDEGIMLEIKTLYSRQIVPGYIPVNYYLQMIIQLYCCNLQQCDFLEIKVEEFDNIVDYFNYNGTTYIHGVVVYDKKKTPKHSYLINPHLSEINDFIKKFENEAVIVKFFRVYQYQIVNVTYNPDLLNDILPDINEAYQILQDLKSGKKKLSSLKPNLFIEDEI